jgi:hypothetical protein
MTNFLHHLGAFAFIMFVISYIGLFLESKKVALIGVLGLVFTGMYFIYYNMAMANTIAAQTQDVIIL